MYSDWDREEGTDDAVLVDAAVGALIGSPKDPLQRPLSNHGVSATADAELLQSAPAQEVDSARVDSMPCAQLAAVYPSTSWDPCHANAELLQSAPAQEVDSARVDSMTCAQLAAVYQSGRWDPCLAAHWPAGSPRPSMRSDGKGVLS